MFCTSRGLGDRCKKTFGPKAEARLLDNLFGSTIPISSDSDPVYKLAGLFLERFPGRTMPEILQIAAHLLSGQEGMQAESPSPSTSKRRLLSENSESSIGIDVSFWKTGLYSSNGHFLPF